MYIHTKHEGVYTLSLSFTVVFTHKSCCTYLALETREHVSGDLILFFNRSQAREAEVLEMQERVQQQLAAAHEQIRLLRYIY